MWLLCFPGAPAVFRSVSCSWLPFLGSAPIWLRLAGLLLQWTFMVGLAVSWCTTWFSTLCQHSFPFRCLPLAGSATFLAPVCWSTPAVEPCCWVGSVFDASLGFLPCAVLFLRNLQLTLQWVPLGIFRSPGVCPSPVGVVSALWRTVSSPCWLSLTLGWVSFWTAVSPVSVGCEVCGLGCPS